MNSEILKNTIRSKQKVVLLRFRCSVNLYIHGRRISQAKHLLINTDFTMGQIARKGYNRTLCRALGGSLCASAG